jgi:hypothetical protein
VEPTEAKELEPGTAVWVWIVRFGKGRWWPGTVQRLGAAEGLHIVKVRLQSFLLGRHRNGPPITVGFVSVRMRRLERRDINGPSLDRPKFVPTSRLRRAETPISANERVEAPDAENVSG